MVTTWRQEWETGLEYEEKLRAMEKMVELRYFGLSNDAKVNA